PLKAAKPQEPSSVQTRCNINACTSPYRLLPSLSFNPTGDRLWNWSRRYQTQSLRPARIGTCTIFCGLTGSLAVYNSAFRLQAAADELLAKSLEDVDPGVRLAMVLGRAGTGVGSGLAIVAAKASTALLSVARVLRAVISGLHHTMGF